MIKKILFSALLLASLTGKAQRGTASAYSYYGVGDYRYKGTIENQSMGGVVLATDSIHFNLENPASLGSLVRTTFAVAGTFRSSKSEDSQASAKTQRSTFDYLAVGVPINSKIGVAFGLVPLSSVGYMSQKISSVDFTESFRQEGKGDLSKVFVATGATVVPGLRLGAEFNYQFGTASYDFIKSVTGLNIATREISDVVFSGVSFNLGMLFDRKITKKLKMFSGVRYQLGYNLNNKYDYKLSTVNYATGAWRDVDVISSSENNLHSLKMPSQLNFDLGIGEPRKWSLGVQYGVTSNSNLSSPYNFSEKVTYQQGSTFGVGGFYTPNYNSFSSYAERMTYRFGFVHEKSNLVVSEQSIDSNAFRLGVGLPIAGSISNANFMLEYGQRGTLNAGLIKENYLNVGVSFSFNDKWFERRKFN